MNLKRGSYWLLLSLLTLFFVAGCQPITAEKATLPWKSEMDVSASSLDEMDEAQAALATAGAAVLADSLGVDVESVELIGMEAVDWPDASLGCPEPDMLYAAMLTPGYVFTYTVDGETFEVHTSTDPDGRIVHCEDS